MTTLFFTAREQIGVATHDGGHWTLRTLPLPDTVIQCVAWDEIAQRLYAGTLDHGLWYTDRVHAHAEDPQWTQVGAGIPHPRITSIAISPTQVVNGYRVVWAGTEPSGLFRSEDGGTTWHERPQLLDLPSKPTWRFPPRPYTHHVRWIEPDASRSPALYIGIELGGVMRSEDEGRTWEDRKPGSQDDCHQLVTTPGAPGRIYEAAGGGYAESRDGGTTWETNNDGLDPHTYLVGIAVDSGDPGTVIVSGATGPRTAYRADTAETYLYRRQEEAPWQRIEKGFPAPEGTTVSALVAHPHTSGVFYAINNRGIFRSMNGGEDWEALPLAWPESLKDKYIADVAISDQ